MSYNTKVYKQQGGAGIVVTSGGVIDASAATGSIIFAAGEVAADDLASNAVETAKIKDAAVTNAKKAETNSLLLVQARKTTVGSNQSGVEIFEFTAPAALTVIGVQVYCTAVTATASVDVKEAGVSILSGAVTPTAGSVVSGTISDSAIASGAAVTVHVTTDGTGAISDLTVTLVCKAAHVS